MVQIIEVSSCGSAASFPAIPGDIVEMKFPFTLVNTTGIFPGMKAHYPGLKKGDIFSADVEQHMKIGYGIEFVANSYEK